MTLALDFTGASGANLVSAEPQSIDSTQNLFAFPAQGPFFEQGALISFTDTNSVSGQLREGVDFKFVFEMRGVATAPNKIYGGIEWLNRRLIGTISFTYQALGGGFVWNQAECYQYMRDHSLNTNTQYAAIAPLPDVLYPNSTSIWVLNSQASLTAFAAAYPGAMLGIKYLDLSLDQSVFHSATGFETETDNGHSGSIAGVTVPSGKAIVALEGNGRRKGGKLTCVSGGVNVGFSGAAPTASIYTQALAAGATLDLGNYTGEVQVYGTSASVVNATEWE